MSSARFASLNASELEKITEARLSENTKNATKYAVRTFRTYLHNKEYPEDFENYTKSDLDARLRTFYAELHNGKGDLYKRTSLLSMRSGLGRHLIKSNGYDISKDAEFNNSNEMFSAMCKKMYREGKGGVTHKEAIEPEDMNKLYTSFVFDVTTPCGLLNKVKQIMNKMLTFFKRELGKGKPINFHNPVRRLSVAAGISESTIRRLTNTEISNTAAVQDVVKSVHESAVKKPAPVTKKLDDFDEGVVRRAIHRMYEKKEFVTMKKLHSDLKERGIEVSLSTVVRTVKKLGFRYSKNGSGQRFLSERQDIVSWRHTYLRKVRKFRQQGRNIVYLDETWLNTNHVVKGDWLDKPSTSMSVFEPSRTGCGRVLPSGKGTRLIILDAGSSQQGLIPGCGLIFESRTNSSDYHDEMNSEHFTEWFKDKLIPKLPPRSVVVMDNAPYHSHLVSGSKVPNTGSKKSEVSAWLDRNNIHYDKEMVKAELLDLVKQNKPRPRYAIDELASEHGHEVLRLPPYHCELNPIEMVWSFLKGFVGRSNSTYKKKDIIKLFEEAKSNFNAESWARFETHVVKEVEEKLWRIDGIRDEEVTPIQFNILTDSEDSNDDNISVEGGEESDLESGDDLNASNTIDDSDDILCKICLAADPPNAKKKEKSFSWFECDLCDQWVHEKCCTKAATKRRMCSQCHDILCNREPGGSLVSPPEDTEG